MLKAADWGTVPDWLGALLNGAVAITALWGLAIARRDARAAETRADAAEAALDEDRLRRRMARLAQHDLRQIEVIMHLHEAAMPSVQLSPLEWGSIRTALALLPSDSLPLTRGWATSGQGSGTRQERQVELREEAQRLVRESVVD